MGARFQVVQGTNGPALSLTIPLSEPKRAVRVVLEEKEVRYFVVNDNDILAVDIRETHVDRGVYLLLAELAAKA